MKQHNIVIYGEKWCPFCLNAKKIAKNMTKHYKFITGKSGLQLKKILKSQKIPKTIPQIIIDGKHIGGFTELKSFYQSKK